MPFACIMCASAAYVRTHRTVLLPAWVILPRCIIPAKFLTDGASQMYATSLSEYENLLMSSISYAMASPVNLHTPGIDMRICAYSLSLTVLFILKSALPLMHSLMESMPFRYSSILQSFRPCSALTNVGANVSP